MRSYIDLSHDIESGMITYRGLPAPVITDYLSRENSGKHYAPGTTFHIGRIDMVANTGTYMDSPFHRYPDGADLSQLRLESLVDLDGICVPLESGRVVDANLFEGLRLEGRAVIIRTGWSRHWRTDAYFEGHPYVTRAAAELLVASKATLVGIDTYNIDDTADGTRPAHTVLLGAGIPIIEHMTNLDQLPTKGFRFFATPPKIRAFGTFPVRAFAIVEK